MGLLDDAIREHLELKRLRGADPGEVAWEEKEALGQANREGQAEHEEQDAGEEQTSPGEEGVFSTDRELSTVEDPSMTGQETIEINMEAELAADADSKQEYEQDAPQFKTVEPMKRSASVPANTEDSLEWEAPRDSRREPAGDAGPNADPDARVDEHSQRGEHLEDVLEETPDFLRDTPEQERLWFEQRPPRDFDFNE